MTADSSGLGTKPVARLALTMSVPTIVAQAANASYTIIDRLFIGHIPEVGDAAMTGVGICFPILLAVTAFASLIARAARRGRPSNWVAAISRRPNASWAPARRSSWPSP